MQILNTCLHREVINNYGDGDWCLECEAEVDPKDYSTDPVEINGELMCPNCFGLVIERNTSNPWSFDIEAICKGCGTTWTNK